VWLALSLPLGRRSVQGLVRNRPRAAPPQLLLLPSLMQRMSVKLPQLMLLLLQLLWGLLCWPNCCCCCCCWKGCNCGIGCSSCCCSCCCCCMVGICCCCGSCCCCCICACWGRAGHGSGAKLALFNPIGVPLVLSRAPPRVCPSHIPQLISRESAAPGMHKLGPGHNVDGVRWLAGESKCSAPLRVSRVNLAQPRTATHA
jgi:hypothetical protein